MFKQIPRIYQEETLELNSYLVWSWLEGEIQKENPSNHDHFQPKNAKNHDFPTRNTLQTTYFA